MSLSLYVVNVLNDRDHAIDRLTEILDLALELHRVPHFRLVQLGFGLEVGQRRRCGDGAFRALLHFIALAPWKKEQKGLKLSWRFISERTKKRKKDFLRLDWKQLLNFLLSFSAGWRRIEDKTPFDFVSEEPSGAKIFSTFAAATDEYQNYALMDHRRPNAEWVCNRRLIGGKENFNGFQEIEKCIL